MCDTCGCGDPNLVSVEVHDRILAEAELQIRRSEAAWACPKCTVAIPAGAVLRCRACDAPAKLISGDEILLEQIEMEVP